MIELNSICRHLDVCWNIHGIRGGRFVIGVFGGCCLGVLAISVAWAHGGYMALKNNTVAYCIERLLHDFLTEPQGLVADFGCTNFFCLYNSFFDPNDSLLDCSSRIPSTSTEPLQLHDVLGLVGRGCLFA